MEIPVFEYEGITINTLDGDDVIVLEFASGDSIGFTTLNGRLCCWGSLIHLSVPEIVALQQWLRAYGHKATLVQILRKHGGESMRRVDLQRIEHWEYVGDGDRERATEILYARWEYVTPPETTPIREDATTCVYLMRDGHTELTKIGHSNKPEIREKTLLSQTPKLALMCYWSGCQPFQERSLHQAFADKRQRGEWFDLSDDDIKQIFTSMAGHPMTSGSGAVELSAGLLN